MLSNIDINKCIENEYLKTEYLCYFNNNDGKIVKNQQVI